MHGFGYQDELQVDNRRFRIHTGCDADKHRVVTEVFEGGQFVYSSTNRFFIRRDSSDTINETYLKSVTTNLHDNTIEEIRLLFYIQEKIKLLAQYMPHYRLGKVFFSRNFIGEAIYNFKRTIELKPDFYRAYKRLGLAYIKTGDLGKAAQICLQVLEQDKPFPDIYDTLGVVYTHMGEYEKARSVLQKAIEIKKDFPEANFNMGIVLFLSTLADLPPEEDVVIPVRVLRTLQQMRGQPNYKNENWQALFDEVSERLASGQKERIHEILLELQLKIATRDDDISTTMDFFFLRFMYGGRTLNQEEMNYYEKKIRQEESEHQGFADYWNELGILHLIQCRDYFLKALENFEQATEINPKYQEAKQTLDLMRHSRKGFLILLRAILK